MTDAAGKTWIVDDRPSRRYPLYTRGNVGEVFPTVVAPLTWSLYGREAEAGWRDAFRDFGVLLEDDFGAEPMGILGVFGGYCYLNASYIRVVAVRTPGLTVEQMDRQFFGESEAPPYVPRTGDRSLVASARIGRMLLRTLNAKALPRLEEDKELVAHWLARLPRPADAGDDELAAVLTAFRPVFRRLFAHHILTSFQATIGPGLLDDLATGKLGDPTLANRLLGGIGQVESAEPSVAMWELSRVAAVHPAVAALFDRGVDEVAAAVEAGKAPEPFASGFAQLLARHGSRGPNEWEISSPTWGTRPELALVAIDRMRQADPRHDPTAQRARLERERLDATAEVRGRLRGPARWQFERALRSAQLFSQGRERSKTTVVRAIHGVRLCLYELARRVGERGGSPDPADLALVTIGELERHVAEPAELAGAVADRRATRDRLAALVPPFVFEGTQPEPDTWESREAARQAVAAGAELAGIAGCPGVARGRARVVLDPLDPRGLGPGEVLVAPLTDPSWTPLFVPAEAVVVDVGAQLSHAVIVARELGIPAVVSVTDATRTIPDGALVEVDGDRGVVRVLEL